MSEWSDDDEVPVAPPPSTKAPPRNTRVEGQLEGGERVPEQQATGAPTQQAKGVPEQQVRGVPKWRAEERPTAETARPPPQGAGIDPKATAWGSGRQRRFRKLYQQADM